MNLHNLLREKESEGNLLLFLLETLHASHSVSLVMSGINYSSAETRAFNFYSKFAVRGFLLACLGPFGRSVSKVSQKLPNWN